MLSPRIHTLEGTQLAWSPATKGKGVTAGLVIIPDVADSMAFQQWLPTVKGKFVMISMNQPTGRPDYNWQEFATKESFDKMKENRQEWGSIRKKNIKDLLIEQYVVRMKNKHNLTLSQSKYLLSIILLL